MYAIPLPLGIKELLISWHDVKIKTKDQKPIFLTIYPLLRDIFMPFSRRLGWARKWNTNGLVQDLNLAHRVDFFGR